jgi:metallo-beta-lactamase class B
MSQESGLTARLSAGHTQGATTWITTVEDGGRSHNVVFLTQTTVNPAFGPAPGYRLVVNPSYPGIADDYRQTFICLLVLCKSIGGADKVGEGANQLLRIDWFM